MQETANERVVVLLHLLPRALAALRVQSLRRRLPPNEVLERFLLGKDTAYRERKLVQERASYLAKHREANVCYYKQLMETAEGRAYLASRAAFHRKKHAYLKKLHQHRARGTDGDPH